MTAELENDAVLADRYKIVRALGHGGMGTVYLAEHLRLKAFFAIKEIRGTFADKAEREAAQQQYEQEANTLVHLNHPNLPKVTDAFDVEDRFYFVMEYVEGVTLEAKLMQNGGRPLPVGEVIHWSLQIASVLNYLHELEPKIIFRDLKPSNVMVQANNSIKLIDFGIARKFQPTASKDTTLLGSVGYSPPEQFGKNQTEPRSDIYAFGATLHHLLTVRNPATTPFKFPPAHTINPLVPESLARLITQCVAIEPDDRPASFTEIADRLRVIQTEAPTTPAQVDTAGSGLFTMQPLGGSSGLVSSGSGRPSPLVPAANAALSANVPPAPITEDGTNATRTILLGLIGTLVLCIIGLGMWIGVRALNKPKPVITIVQQPAPAPVVMHPTEPAAMPDTAAPSAQDSEPMPPPAQNPTAEFYRTAAREIVSDGQGGYLLKIAATGIMRQHTGAASLSAFFYDANGQPLIPVSASTDKRYVNSDGQLSVAYSLPNATEDTPFNLSLYVPLSQFPAAVLNTTLKFKCLIFVDGRRVATTDLQDIPFTLAIAGPKGQMPQNTAPAPHSGGSTVTPFSSPGSHTN